MASDQIMEEDRKVVKNPSSPSATPPCKKSNPKAQFPPFPTLVGEYPILLSKTVDGNAMITTFRVCVCERSSFLNVPLLMLADVAPMETARRLRLACKDGATYVCTFATSEDSRMCLEVLREKTGIPSSLQDMFAFRFYKEAMEKAGSGARLSQAEREQVALCSLAVDSHNLFDQEVLRLGFDTNKHRIWKMSHANENFEFCPTYPKLHILPATVDDEKLKECTDFRAGKRFPSVVWRDSRTGVVLIRSSQPLPSFLGLSYFSNEADVFLLEEIVKACIREREILSRQSSQGGKTTSRQTSTSSISSSSTSNQPPGGSRQSDHASTTTSAPTTPTTGHPSSSSSSSLCSSGQGDDHANSTGSADPSTGVAGTTHGATSSGSTGGGGNDGGGSPLASSSSSSSHQGVVACPSGSPRLDRGVLGLEATNGASPCETPGKPLLAIVDCRSRAMIWGNSFKGGGTEDEAKYNCTIIQLDLPNIHSVRDSFHKLRSLCHSYVEGSYLKTLSGCMWLTYISALLRGANVVVELMYQEKRPVLVHCSDGWDRTTQIVSLAQLLMDPYYRSIKGFQVLVEREWLQFGHKFGERGGHDPHSSDVNQQSPVFLQFVECVYQLTLQYPAHFQFNEAYLVKLLKHSQACLFNTFLHNSERERHRCPYKGASLWSLLKDDNSAFVNLLYSDSKQVLKARYGEHDVGLWKSVYMAGLSPLPHSSLPDFCLEPPGPLVGDEEDSSNEEVKGSSPASGGSNNEAMSRSRSMDDLSKINPDSARRNSDPNLAQSPDTSASSPSSSTLSPTSTNNAATNTTPTTTTTNMHDTSSSSTEIIHYPEDSPPSFHHHSPSTPSPSSTRTKDMGTLCTDIPPTTPTTTTSALSRDDETLIDEDSIPIVVPSSFGSDVVNIDLASNLKDFVTSSSPPPSSSPPSSPPPSSSVPRPDGGEEEVVVTTMVTCSSSSSCVMQEVGTAISPTEANNYAVLSSLPDQTGPAVVASSSSSSCCSGNGGGSALNNGMVCSDPKTSDASPSPLGSPFSSNEETTRQQTLPASKASTRSGASDGRTAISLLSERLAEDEDKKLRSVNGSVTPPEGKGQGEGQSVMSAPTSSPSQHQHSPHLAKTSSFSAAVNCDEAKLLELKTIAQQQLKKTSQSLISSSSSPSSQHPPPPAATNGATSPHNGNAADPDNVKSAGDVGGKEEKKDKEDDSSKKVRPQPIPITSRKANNNGSGGGGHLLLLNGDRAHARSTVTNDEDEDNRRRVRVDTTVSTDTLVGDLDDALQEPVLGMASSPVVPYHQALGIDTRPGDAGYFSSATTTTSTSSRSCSSSSKVKAAASSSASKGHKGSSPGSSSTPPLPSSSSNGCGGSSGSSSSNKGVTRRVRTASGASRGGGGSGSDLGSGPACFNCGSWTDTGRLRHPSSGEMTSARRNIAASVSTSTSDISDSCVGKIPAQPVDRQTVSVRQHLDVDSLTQFSDRRQDLLAQLLCEKDRRIGELESRLAQAMDCLRRSRHQQMQHQQPAAFPLQDEFLLTEPEGGGEHSSLGTISNPASDTSWEQLDESEEKVVLWVPDHIVTHCAGCDKQFCFYRRKHHCRHCGKIFCFECCNYLAAMPNGYMKEPQQVCRLCHSRLMQLSPGASCDGRIPTLVADG